MKTKKITLAKKKQKEIPIFFATDDNYMPFLDVSINSIITNASKKYKYIINVLNTGLRKENVDIVKRQENKNFTINFVDISEAVEGLKDKLKNVYHFGLATYYRLFIQSLFPQYSKVLYLDCDLVVLGDISKLYNTNMGDNIIAAIPDQVIAGKEEFRQYTSIALGIQHQNYINAGVMLMNLDKFREHNIENKFAYLVEHYNFDTIAPDQDYINVLCNGKIKYLPNGWNKAALQNKTEGELNLVHYCLYKKPWQVDDVINGSHFWEYAQKSPFASKIKEIKATFTDEDKAKKERANIQIVDHALKIINSTNTFNNIVFGQKVLNNCNI